MIEKFDVIQDTIARRAEKLIEKVPLKSFRKQGILDLYLAGNSLNAVPGDIDLFPCGEKPFPSSLSRNFPNAWKLVSSTKNATTMVGPKKTVIQLCNFVHPTLIELVKSFDFSHIQVGVWFNLRGTPPRIELIYYSTNWLRFRALGDSQFEGSAYPLSSLVRLFKYRSRREISRGRSLHSVFEILEAIVSRGVEDYEDFKDQIDAVDLGLLPEELESLEGETLHNLFNLLRRDTK